MVEVKTENRFKILYTGGVRVAYQCLDGDNNGMDSLRDKGSYWEVDAITDRKMSGYVNPDSYPNQLKQRIIYSTGLEKSTFFFKK
jgi:hypothetical protein